MRPAAAATLAAVLAAAPGGAPPRAQGVPVIDAQNLIQTSMTAIRALEQIAALKAQLSQLEATYAAIAHPTSVAGAAAAVGGFARQAGPSSADLPGMTSGRGGEWGSAGSRLAEDRVYASPADDEWQREMERRERVTANAKAMMEAAYADAEAHLAGLDGLRAELEAAPDGTATTAQAGAIAIAAQRLEANRAMLAQAGTMLAADDRVTRQRAEQIERRDADERSQRLSAALEGW